ADVVDERIDVGPREVRQRDEQRRDAVHRGPQGGRREGRVDGPEITRLDGALHGVDEVLERAPTGAGDDFEPAVAADPGHGRDAVRPEVLGGGAPVRGPGTTGA